MKFNQIHKGEERQKKNKQLRKSKMFSKLKKRIKNHVGRDYFDEHGLAVKTTEIRLRHGKEHEINWNLTSFKTTGSPYSNKASKAWTKKSRRKDKQKWMKDFDC